jgi:hypothetical protein
MREWNRLVQKTYREGKRKLSSYSLRDAMMDARKLYKRGATAAKNMVKGVSKKLGRKMRGGKTRRQRNQSGGDPAPFDNQKNFGEPISMSKQ